MIPCDRHVRGVAVCLPIHILSLHARHKPRVARNMLRVLARAVGCSCRHLGGAQARGGVGVEGEYAILVDATDREDELVILLAIPDGVRIRRRLCVCAGEQILRLHPRHESRVPRDVKIARRDRHRMLRGIIRIMRVRLAVHPQRRLARLAPWREVFQEHARLGWLFPTGNLHHRGWPWVHRLERSHGLNRVVRRGTGPRGASRGDVRWPSRMWYARSVVDLVGSLVLLAGRLLCALREVTTHGCKGGLSVSLGVQVLRVDTRHVARVARDMMPLGRRMRGGEFGVRDELTPFERVCVRLALSQRGLTRLAIGLGHLVLPPGQEACVPRDVVLL
mmetsp:Transcript_49838/g.112089  ORF Transcript_49838/g.112089 Transcript_49838/m.112089 type:complete len:334 (+) Transcript_49838:1246-2247(+)